MYWIEHQILVLVWKRTIKFTIFFPVYRILAIDMFISSIYYFTRIAYSCPGTFNNSFWSMKSTMKKFPSFLLPQVTLFDFIETFRYKWKHIILALNFFNIYDNKYVYGGYSSNWIYIHLHLCVIFGPFFNTIVVPATSCWSFFINDSK